MKKSDISDAQPPAKILIISDEAVTRQKLHALLQEAGHQVDAAKDPQAAQILLGPNRYDVVITDIIISSPAGAELLKLQNKIAPHIPFVLITSTLNRDEAAKATRAGVAVDYLIKPVSDPDLLRAVTRAIGVKQMLDKNSRLSAEAQRNYHQLEQLVQKQNAELATAYYEVTCAHQFTLDALVAMLDTREKSAGLYSLRIREFALLIADELDLPDDELEDIACGARLHDIGKVAIPDAILLKPGKLTEEEWAVVRTHPQVGYDILRSSKQLESVAEIVLSHHERYDGNGYPRRLKGNDICMGARIFAVVDAYASMRSNRAYRKPLPSKLAVEEIKRCSGTQFHPEIVDAFIRCLPQLLQWDTFDLEQA